MFITSNDIMDKRPNVLTNQNFLASHLDKITLNIDDDLKSKINDDIFKINYEKYSEYIKNFVTARKDRVLNSDIIKNIIKKINKFF